MKSSGIIYYHDWDTHVSQITNHASRKESKSSKKSRNFSSIIGLGMLALAIGGIAGPFIPRVRLEAQYAWIQARVMLQQSNKVTIQQIDKKTPIQPAVFSPLKTLSGETIEPINKDFSIIVPKIGVNAAVIPSVNPNKPGEYLKALEQGVAHSSLSYFPDQDGSVYLFSHSTNYDWFVKDMNAVFYLLKNLEENDDIVIFYKGNAYTYRITGKQIVKPTDVSYMAPQSGQKRLILQTCWPPGSTTERLLIFADLIKEENLSI